MAKVKKQIVVIGLGRFGMTLCKELFEDGANVLAIDSDQDLVNDADGFCTQAVCADATDERVLERLAISNFDTAIVCIGSDVESSIFVTLLCKQMGVKQVIAKAQDDRHRHVLKKIGADRVIIPEEEMAEKLAAALTKPNMIEVMTLTENFKVVEIMTPQKWQNKSLLQLDLRKSEKISVIIVHRGDEIIVTPGGDFVLKPNDILVIAGATADTERLSRKATIEVIKEEKDDEAE